LGGSAETARLSGVVAAVVVRQLKAIKTQFIQMRRLVHRQTAAQTQRAKATVPACAALVSQII
jgi:predicted cobalt transporter CbtA